MDIAFLVRFDWMTEVLNRRRCDGNTRTQFTHSGTHIIQMLKAEKQAATKYDVIKIDG